MGRALGAGEAQPELRLEELLREAALLEQPEVGELVRGRGRGRVRVRIRVFSPQSHR